MNNTEIKNLSVEELKERIAGERESLQKMKFAHAISPIENPLNIRRTRRLIAQLQTELRAKEINS
jgi:large subunit ribosomal protein L29